MAALNQCLALELVAEVNIFFGEVFEQCPYEYFKLIEGVFAVLEKIVVSSPRQVQLVHASDR